VAQIGAAHGLKGDVRLWSFTEDPLAVARYGPLESEDGVRRFDIENLRSGKDHFVARLSGVRDKNAAEALRNTKLYIPRERLPKTEDEESFYHADLIGLAVVTTKGVDIGEVVAVHNFGAGDIVEIRLTDQSTILLPFTDAAVPKVDLEAGRIIIDPPEGVFDKNIPPLKGEGRRGSRRGGVAGSNVCPPPPRSPLSRGRQMR
jgi:16S rRNA processing protein RimM